MNGKLLAAMIAATLLPVAAPAAVIDFSGTTAGGALTSLTQNGYTIAADAGRFVYAGGFNPIYTESLYTGGYGVPTTTASASFNVTSSNGGLFSFKSLDYLGFASADGVRGGAFLTITGYNASVQQFRQEILGDVSFSTILSSASSVAIDRLNVSTSGWTLYFDNITVDSAVSAVPEPAIWALMVGGFGLIGMAMRRRALVIA